ncbi:hypothetical protein ACJJTC_005956 [Scirpophaga incertulas]
MLTIYSYGVESLGIENNVNGTLTMSPPLNTRSESMQCVVGGAHAFILRVSSFFGLAPLRFEPRETGYTVSISSAMCIYSFILVTVLLILTVVGLIAEINVGLELSVRMTSRMSQIVSACDVLVVVLSASIGVYGAPARMRKMLKYMNKVALVS